MTDLTNENIWERRFEAAIERFGSFDECMEIPGYGVEPECPPTPIVTDSQEFQNNVEKRFEACKQHYRGMEEYMEIPDMDLWLKLKNEIIPKRLLLQLERHVCQTFYTDEFQTASIGMNDVRDFDPTLDGIHGVNSSDYVDDDDDYDNYSLDSSDKKERRYLRFKDKWLEYDHRFN